MTSIGGLPAGLSEEDFFSGVSLPRNRVEELGSGMNRILKSYDKSIFKIADSYIRVSFKYVMGRDEQSGISSQNFNQSTKWTDVPSRKVASTEALKADMLSFIRKNPSASYQQIGDDVDIGFGAVIIGGVKIPNNCKIGANAVVITSFYEEGLTLVGNPAHAVVSKGKENEV